jgi:hypothetical protein
VARQSSQTFAFPSEWGDFACSALISTVVPARKTHSKRAADALSFP